MKRDDALIVGGGPVGLATAIALRAEGLAVTVLDARRPLIDKACGEGLMPDAVEWLERHGIERDRLRGVSLRGIRYLDGERVAEGAFDGGSGLGVRRTELHRALVATAESRGIELEWGTRVTGLIDGRLQTPSGRRSAAWLVGADGLDSRIRRWSGLDREVRKKESSRRRTGLRRHFRTAPWTDLVEVYWTNEREAYVTPVAEDEVGVAILQSGQPLPFESALESFPRLIRKLGGAAPASRVRGGGPLDRRARDLVRANLALVGDAAGYRDAITGEGLALGFHLADALARAVAAQDLARYRSEARRLMRLPFALIGLLLFVERHPGLRRRLIDAFAGDSELFDRFLAVHARQRPPLSIGVGGAVRLAAGMVGAARATSAG